MKTVFIRCSAALTIAALLAGCGGGGGTAPAPTALTSTGQFRSLQFTLTTQSSFARGQQVPFTFSMKNTETQPVVIDIGPAPDFTITRNGQVVYQDSLKFGTFGGYHVYSLGPGETISDNLTWSGKDLQDQAVPPGQYTLKVWARLGGVEGTTFTSEAMLEDSLTAPPVTITVR